MAPPDAVSIFRKMQTNGGGMLGEDEATRPRMGVKTAANDIFVVTGIEPTDSPTDVMVTTEGEKLWRLEKSVLRPLVRGRDVRAWGHSVRDAIIWTHDDRTGQVRKSLPKRAEEYFYQHVKELKGRDDFKEGMPPWALFRVSQEKLGLKVAWKKYGTEMQSSILEPEHLMDLTGGNLLVPLQTVYFIPVRSREDGLLIAGVFNSIPFKTLMMSFAVRLRGAYFHYTAWIVGLGLMPVSPGRLEGSWRKYNGTPAEPGAVQEIIRLSKLLHGDLRPSNRKRHQGELDRAVAEAFHVTDAEFETLTEYYRFMRPLQAEPELLGLEEAETEEE